METKIIKIKLLKLILLEIQLDLTDGALKEWLAI